jgi:hypothetical protein
VVSKGSRGRVARAVRGGDKGGELRRRKSLGRDDHFLRCIACDLTWV